MGLGRLALVPRVAWLGPLLKPVKVAHQARSAGFVAWHSWPA